MRPPGLESVLVGVELVGAGHHDDHRAQRVEHIDRRALRREHVGQSTICLRRFVEAATTEEFDYSQYQDTYTSKLRELIEAKVAGKEVVTVAEEEKAPVDIMTALKQSIERTKGQKKPMEKAKGEKKPAVEAAPVKQKKQKVA